MVGEGAVELEVEGYDVQWQAVEHARHRVPAHAVAGVDDNLERADVAQVDELAQEDRVGGQQVDVLDVTRLAVGTGDNPCSASSCISASPLSWPTGLAPARHSLMPL